MQDGWQQLVYEMQLATARDVAMVLPLPTAEDESPQLEFISLSEYPDFFRDLDRCFPAPAPVAVSAAVAASAGGNVKVIPVGSFNASFLPSQRDFDRLDPRFRLNRDILAVLPQYARYSFAIFQLRSGEHQIHPMALRFRTRDSTTLFFPTLHVHDAAIHESAHFDHELYAQGGFGADWVRGAHAPRSTMDFGNFLVADRTRGLVQPDAAVFKGTLFGELPNVDHWVRCFGERTG
ncbi:MAG: hypothetical protein HOW73_49095 [Polyangiaceae bacterium]|nr:hypothetical protein [Polyangiaceae bacterium]